MSFGTWNERGKAVTLRMDEVVATEIEWLWPGLIPQGKLVVLCGDPGLGKSFCTLDMAARVSSGAEWPLGGEATGPGDVLLCSAEDDPADTIKPRLMKMDADLTRIHFIDSIQHSGGVFSEFVIGQHAAVIRDLIDKLPKVKLMVIDPVSAYVGETDSYNNAQVRAMLKPLADVAAEKGVTIILVTHVRKAEAAKALHRAMGSLAFTAAARVVLMVTKDKTQPDLRVMATVKSNIGNDRTGITYRIEGGKVEWEEYVEVNADEAEAKGSRQGLEEFFQAVRDSIERDGPQPGSAFRPIADRLGLNWVSVMNTRTRIQYGVHTVGRGPGSLWTLQPQDDEPTKKGGK